MSIVTVSGKTSGFAQEVVVGPHRLVADEPVEAGGTALAPIPMISCWRHSGREPRFDRIEREILLDGNLSHGQRTRLLEIADRCPVHRTLTSEINIRTRLA
jgi:hypothetical protein